MAKSRRAGTPPCLGRVQATELISTDRAWCPINTSTRPCARVSQVFGSESLRLKQMTSSASLTYAVTGDATSLGHRAAVSSSRRGVLRAAWPLLLVTIVAASWTISLRWHRATSLPLQCDEITLLLRFTSLTGVAAAEAEAREFRPSLFSLRTGSLRSARVPNYVFTAHTTAGFWSNLALNLFGYSSGAVRSVQVCWSLVAIVAAAWAAWLVVRSLPAACVAAWIVALSPFSLA